MMKIAIKIILTVLLLFVLLPSMLIFSFLTDKTVRYEFASPEKEMVKELEEALGVSFPVEPGISMITKSRPTLIPDEPVEIRVYSNWNQDEWEQLLGGSWERTIGDWATTLSFHRKWIPGGNGSRGYVAFTVASRLLFTDYNFMNATRRNDTLWRVGQWVWLSLHILVLIAIWFPYKTVWYRITDPTGEKRLAKLGIQIPNGSGEREKDF